MLHFTFAFLHILTLIFLSHPKRPYEVLVSSTEVLNEVKQKRLRVADGSSLPLYSSATQSPLRLPTVSPHHGEVRRGGMRPNLQAKNQYSHCHFSSCSLWRYQKTISFILKCSYFFSEGWTCAPELQRVKHRAIQTSANTDVSRGEPVGVGNKVV